MVEEKFLIDFNSFIAPYRQYCAFDLVPTYWDELAKDLGVKTDNIYYMMRQLGIKI